MEERRIYLGQLTQQEVDQVETKIERLAGLEELLLITEDSNLVKKIQSEASELRTYCDNWYKSITIKKNWEYTQDDWEVDFTQNKVWRIEKI